MDDPRDDSGRTKQPPESGALTLGTSPPQIPVSAPSVILVAPRELENATTAVQFSHATMSEFTEILMGFIQDRQIVDETGLEGRYDFTMIPTVSQGGSDTDKAAAFLLGVNGLVFKS